MSSRKRWICLIVAAVLISAGGFWYYQWSGVNAKENGGSFVEAIDAFEVLQKGTGGLL